jgi:hypothetical protein
VRADLPSRVLLSACVPFKALTLSARMDKSFYHNSKQMIFSCSSLKLRCAWLSLAVLSLALNAYSDDAELQRGISIKPVFANNPATNNQWTLRDALCLGEFGDKSIDAALNHSFIDEATVAPRQGDHAAGHDWALTHADLDVFRPTEFLQAGGQYFSVYFSFWIYSPSSVSSDENVTLTCMFCSKLKAYLNGKLLDQGSPNTGDDLRVSNQYPSMELRKGWNHFLIKVAGCDQDIDKVQQKASLLVFMDCSDVDLLKKLNSAVAVKPEQNASDDIPQLK